MTIQIRPMVNGFPSSSLVLPFSEVTLNPDMVVKSSNSSNTTTSTTFSFESPVYLTPDSGNYDSVKQYRIHITYYKVWRKCRGTTRKISKQPFVGSFYRPQNGGELGKR